MSEDQFNKLILNTLEKHDAMLKELSKTVTQYECSISDIKNDVKEMSDNIKALTKTISIDNGKPSVLSRLSTLEADKDYRKEQRATGKDNKRWFIGSVITVFVGMVTCWLMWTGPRDTEPQKGTQSPKTAITQQLPPSTGPDSTEKKWK